MIVSLNVAQTRALNRLYKKVDVLTLAFESDGKPDSEVVFSIKDRMGWAITVKIDTDGIPTKIKKTSKDYVIDLSQETLDYLFVEEVVPLLNLEEQD